MCVRARARARACIQHAMRNQNVIRRMEALHFVFHIISKILRIYKNVTEYKTYVLIFPPTFALNISHSKKKRATYDHNRMLVFM